MPNAADYELIQLVQRLINRGHRVIRVPADLTNFATEEGLEEVRRLCRLTGVTIELEE